MNRLIATIFVSFLAITAFSQQTYTTEFVSTHENPDGNPTSWAIYLDNSEIKIEYLFENCDPAMGYDFEQVNLRFTNKTTNKIGLDWHILLDYDKECKTCDYPFEYARNLYLESGETMEGTCARECVDALKLFVQFNDANYTKGQKLTGFKLGNLTLTVVQ